MPRTQRADTGGVGRVTVDIPDAALDFQPGGDDRVHLRATGRCLGAQPRLTATTEHRRGDEVGSPAAAVAL
ncbi:MULTISPECIES: hypothetical protein [Cryobacterium]|uniref:Uncharacterized protein n=1 Tax=Cryobacterium mannosilyticum TaxID=1259190 RepID=A0A4R8WDN8_9MICO|nr:MULTISPECIES: hypothetical protein [Cryobacterium]TFB97233.1 hypothetical protein E3O48_03710 [Cryobacterium sp. HLT2-28]TFC07335.1 hypothetical protein E3O32_02130 [Cryobacterium mannosilyticum]